MQLFNNLAVMDSNSRGSYLSALYVVAVTPQMYEKISGRISQAMGNEELVLYSVLLRVDVAIIDLYRKLCARTYKG